MPLPSSGRAVGTLIGTTTKPGHPLRLTVPDFRVRGDRPIDIPCLPSEALAQSVPDLFRDRKSGPDAGVVGKRTRSGGFLVAPCRRRFHLLGKLGVSPGQEVGAVAVSLMSICVALLLFQEVEQLASVLLTWNRRSTDELRKFVEVNVPNGATVYGPVGRYFYAVELSGHQYLYTHEHTTPGLYSETRIPIADTIDAQICSHPTYGIWSKPDPIHQPQEEPLPAVLQDRLNAKVGEFNQPPLSAWRERVLERFGEIGGKYGFPDAVIYSLKSMTPCQKK